MRLRINANGWPWCRGGITVSTDSEQLVVDTSDLEVEPPALRKYRDRLTMDEDEVREVAEQTPTEGMTDLLESLAPDVGGKPKTQRDNEDARSIPDNTFCFLCRSNEAVLERDVNVRGELRLGTPLCYSCNEELEERSDA